MSHLRLTELPIFAHVEHAVGSGQSRAIVNDSGEFDSEFEELLHLITSVPGTSPALGHESRPDVLPADQLEKEVVNFMAEHMDTNSEGARELTVLSALVWHDHLDLARERLGTMGKDENVERVWLRLLVARRRGEIAEAEQMGKEISRRFKAGDEEMQALVYMIQAAVQEVLQKKSTESSDFGTRLLAKRLQDELLVKGQWDCKAMLDAVARVNGAFEDPAYDILQEVQALEWESLVNSASIEWDAMGLDDADLNDDDWTMDDDDDDEDQN